MSGYFTIVKLDECLQRAREAVVLICRRNGKRLGCDPEELIGDVLERLYFTLAAGQSIHDVVHYARRCARCDAKRRCVEASEPPPMLNSDPAVETQQPVDWLIASEEHQAVRQEIERLPSEVRTVLWNFLDGIPAQASYRDVLGRRMRAFRLLRERLRRRGIED